jgi:glutamate/tyrosine decarboxylase-like PLP-dependent enzyme
VEVIEHLAAGAGPGLVKSPGGRYFGFVTGGALPAALGAEWLTAAWDQNAFSYVSSPAASVIEDVAGRWLLEILGLPLQSSVAFVTGCQMAHVTALAAARHRVLDGVGWDVQRDGLAGAPPIRVIAGDRRHATVDRALRLLGIGSAAIEEVASDGLGRMRVGPARDALRESRAHPAVLVLQAGEVNTGSFDPFEPLVEAAREADAWVHVDGAFGLWARASRTTAGLAMGVDGADSWAFDAHKWLNVPYDSGVAVVAHPESHAASMAYGAAYLAPSDDRRDPSDWTPDASRRARGIAVYAALRSLGRSGVAGLVERCCRHARTFAEGLAGLGLEVLNEVELNQVLVRAATDDVTTALLQTVQRSGETWMSGTVWGGRPAIRISVSGWSTTDADVVRSLAAFRTALAAPNVRPE